MTQDSKDEAGARPGAALDEIQTETGPQQLTQTRAGHIDPDATCVIEVPRSKLFGK